MRTANGSGIRRRSPTGPATSSLEVIESLTMKTSNTGDMPMPKRTARSRRVMGTAFTRVTPALSTWLSATMRTPRAGSDSTRSLAWSARRDTSSRFTKDSTADIPLPLLTTARRRTRESCHCFAGPRDEAGKDRCARRDAREIDPFVRAVIVAADGAESVQDRRAQRRHDVRVGSAAGRRRLQLEAEIPCELPSQLDQPLRRRVLLHRRILDVHVHIRGDSVDLGSLEDRTDPLGGCGERRSVPGSDVDIHLAEFGHDVGWCGTGKHADILAQTDLR